MAESKQNERETKSARFEFRRDPENDMLIGPDECHYDTEAEALFYDLPASCGCGRPREVHAFLIECLKCFSLVAGRSGVTGIEQIVRDNPEIAAEFVGHYLNSAHLAEHGSSVFSSWITERGKQFIEAGPNDD